MLKWLMVALACFCCTGAHASSLAEKVEALSAKVILENTQGYFVLSDKSCWKVVGFAKRWRTLTEWWNSVELVPDNYECVPNDWFLGAHVAVYPKYQHLEVNEANASNQDVLRQCTHLLVNTRTNQVLFAIALEPSECVIQLFSDAHQDGYNKGFTQGRLKSYQNATEVYNSGHAEGYKVGYADGFQKALKE